MEISGVQRVFTLILRGKFLYNGRLFKNLRFLT